MRVLEGKLVDSSIKVGIVAARFNEFIVSKLVAGAKDGLVRHNVSEENIDLAWVPGAFEIPLIASKMAKSGKYDAVICLGAVIRGATSHYDYVCREVSKGIANVSLASDIPVMFGVLTTDTIEQAIERAGTKAGNKGFECAECYRDIIKESFEDYGVDTCVTVSMKGSAIGDMSDKDRDNLADRMLKMLDAKTVTSGKVQDSYMVYAYTKDVKDSISLGKKKINVNITMNYDEIRNMTDITLSTPVYSGDF